ncbi:Alpha-L-rhamnosidase N-terminal domain-containing protein [Pedobacter westerhofensis]|uniref:Alpha-L-rhamnosidase N-terminal domain-containing protein n=1 Tax=Pedobacter westerhofensis TaxID=425512 RepID=A0A521FB90_9SPHI|nr:family 78 glycoside hydrolase catalytic domain [Pedobacter westerhofensis]SMO93458.1 Alpha-L-rhamnosidase N-terminal domain-containing protein [Pedobacter westerhofensis]
MLQFFRTILCRFVLLAFLCPSLASNVYSQSAAAPAHPWTANWIASQSNTGTEYGVYYFRKSFSLDSRPGSFKIYVSADNRYKLFVNEVLVSMGPARGDTYNWNYETVDLAPYLKQGKNTISALVFNEGQYQPVAQISFRTALMLQGSSKAEDVVNTNKSWKCYNDQSHQPFPGWFPIAATKGENVNMNLALGNWNKNNFDDSSWPFAKDLSEARPKGKTDGFGLMLVPSTLPQMELSYQRISTLRKATGMNVPAGFPKSKVAITIPAHSVVTLLLDQDTLSNAYINLLCSGGKGGSVTLRYAESLYEYIKTGRRKGNRNDVEGKTFSGRADSVITNGKAAQEFTTLNYRTFRYVQVSIRTADEPLTISDLYGTFTGYPFKLKATLNTSDAEIKKIAAIGWRTARLCAVETYFDCPYYEQLQYVGDTRIQAMVSYFNAGNDTLARNAINQIEHSRLPEGVTQSRWPSRENQVIPGFSLWYIGMLHDYWMYRNDQNFIKDKLTGSRAILNFFARYQQADGSLKDVPFWTFVDWADRNGWTAGGPPKGADGSSAAFDLQLLWAYQCSAEMEAKLGMPAMADIYRQKAAQLTQTIRSKYWSTTKQLFAETIEKNTFSQHTNSLAILTGAAAKDQWTALATKMLSDTTLTQCSIYFRYYMHMALVKAGRGDDYLSWLDAWRSNMALGLSTWAEEPDVQHSRSDCHAWGASPNIEIYRTLLGIDSDSPGFQKIKIAPHLGSITTISGSMPHPNGKVDVAYTLKGNDWDIHISLPEKTNGTFVWKSKSYPLKPGENSFSFRNTGV